MLKTLWNVRISGFVQNVWQLQSLQTNECFKRPEENFCQRENADAQKDTWDQSKLIILIITRSVCLPLQFWVLTKPGSHVNQDFDGGPLQASLILYKMERKLWTPSYPKQCFRQRTHWEERCHCQQHHRSMIPVSQAKWSWQSTCLLWNIFTWRIISCFLSSSYWNRERLSSEVVLVT